MSSRRPSPSPGGGSRRYPPVIRRDFGCTASHAGCWPMIGVASHGNGSGLPDPPRASGRDRHGRPTATHGVFRPLSCRRVYCRPRAVVSRNVQAYALPGSLAVTPIRIRSARRRCSWKLANCSRLTYTARLLLRISQPARMYRSANSTCGSVASGRLAATSPRNPSTPGISAITVAA